MILPFVLFAILFAPGNTFMFSALVMFCAPHMKVKWDLPQRLFVLFLVVSFIGVLASKYHGIAFFGSQFRSQGWIAWLICARIACLYWGCFDSLEPVNFWSLLYGAIFLAICFVMMGLLHVKSESIHDSMVGSYFAIVAVMLWAFTPSASILAMVPVLISGERSGFFAFAIGILTYSLFRKGLWTKRRLRAAGVGLLMTAILIPFTPLKEKLFHMELSSIGHGARAHWMMEGEKLATHWAPFGFGFDSQEFYLTKPQGALQPSGVPDRCHNVAWDIILMNGWLGYTICLLILGSVIGITVKHPHSMNVTCLSGLMAWVAFGFFNPYGTASNVLMLICLFGIHRKHE